MKASIVRCLLVLLVLAIDARSVVAVGQTARPGRKPAADAALAKQVTLNLGACTLSQALAALGRQTGLTIEPAEYLRSRRLTVEMAVLPARDALDALCAVNEWTWERDDSGSYVVRRRPVRPASSPAAVGAALRSAIPSDFRTFLSLDRPTGTPSDSPFPTEIGRAGNLVYAAGTRIGAAFSVKAVADGHDIGYARLTSDQQNELLRLIVFGVFHGDDQELWADGSWGFHRISMPEVWLSLEQGQILMVESEGHSGFGQNIMAPPRPPRTP